MVTCDHVTRSAAGPSADSSVYTGSAGVALLHVHVALSLHEVGERRSKHLHQALSLLAPSLRHLTRDRKRTFLCGAAGPLAIAAVCHAALGNMVEAEVRRRGGGCLVVQRRWRSWEESGGSVAMVTMQSLLPSQLLIGQLEELYTCHKTLFSRLPSELLYGHTGYLYALLFVNSYIPGAVPDSTLEEVRGEREGGME